MLPNLLLPRLIAPVPRPPEWLRGDWRLRQEAGVKAFDLSRYRKHGDITDGAWGSGLHGKSLVFNGSSTYIEIPYSSVYDITDKITVMAWVYMETATAARYVVGKGADIYALYFSGTTKIPHAYITGDSASGALSFGTAIDLDEWTHLAWTFDENGGVSNWKTYINGVAKDTHTMATAIATDTRAVWIGIDFWGAAWFDGMISLVRIYNRVLSLSEIAAFYNATR